MNYRAKSCKIRTYCCFLGCAAAGLVLGELTDAKDADEGCVVAGPSSKVALRMTASGDVVVKPGLLVSWASYHCGGKYHRESPEADR